MKEMKNYSLNMSINIILLTKISSSSSSAHNYISFLYMDQAMLLSSGEKMCTKKNMHHFCMGSSIIYPVCEDLVMSRMELQGGKILGLEQL